MIEREELAAWLRLLGTPRVGRTSARRLLRAFGSPQGVCEASGSALREVVDAGVAAALADAPAELDERVETTWRWLNEAGEAGRSIVTLGDARYPAALLETADPPLLLYLHGDAGLLGAPAIAVVGSRNPTPQGTENARAFAREFSGAGYTVVSGMALGIDGAAHAGGLEGAASSIAVVGTGLDRVYPARHRELARRLARDGLLATEYPLGTPPLAENFPQRNRIIAGLAQGTLVVEATQQSGSLITARLAAEAGREVFAIPGSIHSPQSRGCHALIKQGAKLVDSARDVLDELRPADRAARPADPPAPPEPTAESSLLAALGHEPTSLDALVARTGCPPQLLSAQLLELELEGRVARLPGQLFQRIGRG